MLEVPKVCSMSPALNFLIPLTTSPSFGQGQPSLCCPKVHTLSEPRHAPQHSSVSCSSSSLPLLWDPRLKEAVGRSEEEELSKGTRKEVLARELLSPLRAGAMRSNSLCCHMLIGLASCFWMRDLQLLGLYIIYLFGIRQGNRGPLLGSQS